MNVLIYGASNAIAIGIARFLRDIGHTAVMADSERYSRAFFSRYCAKKYLFRDPLTDRAGFAADLAACINNAAISLIVPTTDETLLNLLEARDVIPENVRTTFPLDAGKVQYVLDKTNLPELCEKAGVRTPATERVDEGFEISRIEGFQAPFALKRASGVAGEGFMRVDRRELLGSALASVKRAYPESSLLVQEYIPGSVYGAGGLFDGETLRHFYSYKYVRRHPRLSGSPTMCHLQNLDSIRVAMERVLAVLNWNGYCQMDFILDEKSGQPFLTDINPVHWYSLPFSMSGDPNCLAAYCGRDEYPETEQLPVGPYTTFSLLRELQRVLAGGIFGKNGSGCSKDYLQYYRHIRRADFYWDPLPVVLAPVLKLLRAARGTF